jgi:hypothetical protein
VQINSHSIPRLTGQRSCPVQLPSLVVLQAFAFTNSRSESLYYNFEMSNTHDHGSVRTRHPAEIMQFLPQSPRYEQWTMLNLAAGIGFSFSLAIITLRRRQSSLSVASAAPPSAAESAIAATSPSEEGVMEEGVSEEDVSAEPRV